VLPLWHGVSGLKLGLYSDIGSTTCGGYLGMEGHFEQDAHTFAAWGIDMLKVRGKRDLGVLVMIIIVMIMIMIIIIIIAIPPILTIH
jgi:hypothetical protein